MRAVNAFVSSVAFSLAVLLPQLSFAQIPNELLQKLAPLPVIHDGACSLDKEQKIIFPRCLVATDGEYFYVVIIDKRPVQVVRVTIKQPEEQVVMWTDPLAMI